MHLKPFSLLVNVCSFNFQIHVHDGQYSQQDNNEEHIIIAMI